MSSYERSTSSKPPLLCVRIEWFPRLRLFIAPGRHRLTFSILKCILPVIEGLIPDHDALLRSLLFCAANWLSLAKLHVHSESTLHVLNKLTKEYGRLTRQLARDTENVKMVETPREAEIRRRRKVPGSTAASESGPKSKPITNSTFKHHMMTHYVLAIMFWGTVDSFTTGIVRPLYVYLIGRCYRSHYLVLGRD